MTVQHQFGAFTPQDCQKRLPIPQGPAPGLADRWVVNEHDPEAVLAVELPQHRCQSFDLSGPKAAGRETGRRWNCGGQPNQRHVAAMAAHEREDRAIRVCSVALHVIRPAPDALSPGHRHQRIMVARHHGHARRRAEAGEEVSAGGELRRQGEVCQVTSDRDEVRRVQCDVPEQRRQRAPGRLAPLLSAPRKVGQQLLPAEAPQWRQADGRQMRIR